MADMPFEHWIFQQLVTFGAIRDYEKTPHVGKGRSPKGNLSIQIGRISELRESSNPDEKVWGLIAYAGLQSEGQIGKRLTPIVQEFCDKTNPDDPAKLFKHMKTAAGLAFSEYNKRYKEKVLA